jgi:hypothetical protein
VRAASLTGWCFKVPCDEKRRLEGMGIRKMTAREEWGKVLDISGKVFGAGKPAICVTFLWLFCQR